MNKKYLIPSIVVVVTMLIGFFYYLYSTYPNTPEIVLQEEGYKVTAIIKFTKDEIPIEIYRNTILITTIKSAGSHSLEYMSPGNHAYEFRYAAKNLFGIEKNINQIKKLTIKELTNSELQQYFDFPVVNMTTADYGIYITYPELKQFSNFVIFRNNQSVKSFSLANIKDELIEYISPGKYVYEILFYSDEFKNLAGLLRQDYEIEVESIPPIIVSIKPTPLYKGYSSEITAIVENASSCSAELLLHPPSGFERSEPTVLKSYEFIVGNKLDYFYRHNESWLWEEILFPKPTDINTANYNIDLKLTCFDYYDSINTEKIGRFLTSEDISPTSISISYHNGQSGKVYGEVTSQTWTDLNCKLLIGDQENYTLDEKSFLLQGRHTYEFNIDSYNRNLLYITAICKDSGGHGVTKISTYQAE